MFLLCFAINVDQECKKAFQKYKQQYRRSYSNESEVLPVFCENYHAIVNCLDCSQHFGPKMDTNLSQLSQFQKKFSEGVQRKRGLTSICQQYYCGINPPVANLVDVYQSVDLRTLGLVTRAKDQGSCGACYMFGGVAIMENALLLDQKLVQRTIKGNSRELNISELYAITNIAFQKYCKGGNAISAFSFLQDYRDDLTLHEGINYYVFNAQLAKDFVYNAKNVEQGQQYYQEKYVYVPKINEANLPFSAFQTKASVDGIEYSFKTPNIIIAQYAAKSEQSFNTEEIQTIMSYLSRGYAVIAAMHTSSAQAKLQSYSGGVIHVACNKQVQDHQVTIVGYGKKDNQWVWIVKNSWGAGWGDEGCFYVPIGKNSFCIEQEATVHKSEFHDQRNGDLIFNRTQGFLSNYKKPLYLDADQMGLIKLSNLNANCLQQNNCVEQVTALNDGYDAAQFNNINADDTDFEEEKTPVSAFLVVVLCIFGVLVLIGLIIGIVFCVRSSKMKKVEQGAEQVQYNPYLAQNGQVVQPSNFPQQPQAQVSVVEY